MTFANMFLSGLAKSSCSSALPSKNFYDKWDSHLNSIKDYYDICKEDKYKNNDKFLKLCSMALLYLRNYDKSTERKSLPCNRCRLFNYWIVDQLNKTFGGERNLAFGFLNFIVNKVRDNSQFIKNNECELDLEVSSDDKWEEKKEFYEYVIDYFQINTRDKLNHETCKKYINYLQDKSSLNTYIKKILPDVKDNKLSKIYGKCRNVNQKILLSKLQNNPNDLIYDDSEEEGGLQQLPKLEGISEEDASDDGRINGPMPFSVPQGKFDVSYYIKSINSSPYTMPSILSVTGVSALAMFLNKFKSSGFLLRGGRVRRTHFADGFNKESANEFPDYYAGYPIDNLENDRINIAYQTT
ncbi:variable surface protein Vir16/32 [Plasmodium vivax India VII]|uniref:Variable surface protein Vir16/32 n=1 Tax=Plasmodium vivax India VII TaxID=1077284 RepID=A0A0J9SF09_PLAVI|nr:variable surface protein Vir16/32 [Plasmodium vivax India VII]CAI7719348.1 PIR protein [Plasmodium vivax]